MNMCIRTEDGYLMNDGTLIKFGSNLAGIQPKHIAELSEMPPSAWDFFIMMQSVDNRLKNHNSACPVQPEGIIELVDSRLKSLPRKVLKSSSDTVKDISFIIMAGAALLKAFGII